VLLVFSNRQKSQKFQQIVMVFLIGLFSFIFDNKNISSLANVSQTWTRKVWGSQRHCWRFRSLGMWHCIVGSLVPKVMEEHTAFILRTKQSKKNMNCWTLNIKALWSFETVGTTDLTMQCHMPADLNSKILTFIF